MDNPANDKATSLEEEFEGFSATPYLDTVAKPPVWTIGFGNIWWFDGSPVTASTRAISRDEATQLMNRELQKTTLAIARLVKAPLTDNEKAALEDFIYNLGEGNFASSTLLKLLNRGNYDAAAQEFEKWDHAGGKVVAGLLRRRIAERDLFLTPS